MYDHTTLRHAGCNQGLRVSKKKKKGERERERVTGIMMLFKCRTTHMGHLFADALVFSVCFEKYF
jgi:hypothetical protein